MTLTNLGCFLVFIGVIKKSSGRASHTLHQGSRGRFIERGERAEKEAEKVAERGADTSLWGQE